MAKKQVFIHTRLSRAYLALARLSCIVTAAYVICHRVISLSYALACHMQT